jgi:hypothetical protein
VTSFACGGAGKIAIMNRTMLTAITLLTVTAVAACTGSADGPVPDAVTYGSGAALADALGCADYQGGSQEMFVADGGLCAIGSNHTVIVDTFASQDDAIHYADIAKTVAGVYVVGDRWVVGVDTQDEAEKVIRTLGGSLH